MLEDKRKEQERQEKSRQLEKQLVNILWSLLPVLDQQMDRRLYTHSWD